MRLAQLFTLDPVTVTRSVWTPNGSREDHGIRWGLAARLVDKGWPTMRNRKARIPLGEQVHPEQWGDTVLLVDFDSGEHGGGL